MQQLNHKISIEKGLENFDELQADVFMIFTCHNGGGGGGGGGGVWSRFFAGARNKNCVCENFFQLALSNKDVFPV